MQIHQATEEIRPDAGMNYSSAPLKHAVAAFRIILGVIFAFSGGTKLLDVKSLEDTIGALAIVPAWSIPALAIAIPVVECASGLSLILGYRVRASSGVIIGLLMLFIAVIIPALWEKNPIDCGCFGPLMKEPIGTGLLVRDAVLLMLAVTVFSSPHHEFALDNYPPKENIHDGRGEETV